MNTDTPETDSHYYPDFEMGGDVVLADFARELERERDEARAEMIRWMSIAEGRGRPDDKPDTQAELTMKTPKEKASEDIIDAWLIEGVHPPTHRKLKEQLRQEWPVLAKAIERLVNAEDSPELADAIRQRDEARGQRDRLAEVIEAASVLIAAKGRHNTMLAYDGLREALQSLTPNETISNQ